MRLGGRLAGAIEVLTDIESRKRPVADALKDWGLNHRFAGSGDRAAIGNIVYDALRMRHGDIGSYDNIGTVFIDAFNHGIYIGILNGSITQKRLSACPHCIFPPLEAFGKQYTVLLNQFPDHRHNHLFFFVTRDFSSRKIFF